MVVLVLVWLLDTGLGCAHTICHTKSWQFPSFAVQRKKANVLP